MASNDSLNRAKAAGEDEFYTRIEDVERELRHYRGHFSGKSVLCNCDDPFESNFFRYFVLNFNKLGLRRLVATCYDGSPVAGTQASLFDLGGTADGGRARRPYKAVVTSVRDATGDGAVTMDDVAELFRTGENTVEELEGNGDFRSPECLELLDEADIVVTNPPFSLWREYVATLVSHNKKFVIIGPQNALKYKEVFPLLKDGEMWLGYGFQHGDAYFSVPSGKAGSYAKGVYDEKTGLVHFRNCAWYTNLDIRKRHEELVLVKHYDEDKYPHYTNFDGIDVSSVADIPCDYAGNMGVPITFMENYNPDQFDLIGTSTGELGRSIGVKPNHRGRTDLAYIGGDGKPHCPYQRFIIRNRHPEGTEARP